MTTWKDLLAVANPKQTLARAKSCLGKNTKYVLGAGGINPVKDFTPTCDCSGFVAWAIGIPRELPPGSGHWLQTTTYWEGDGGHFDPVSSGTAQPGDIYVYPDVNNKQGHMGIITEVSGSGVPTKVVHCSKGNDNNGDAVQETPPTVFSGNAKSRIMRVDYAALRGSFGIAEPEGSTFEEAAPPVPMVILQSLLSGNSTMREIAAGRLILEPDGEQTGGAAALQEALNLLATGTPAHAVDLGTGESEKGFFGKKTTTALKAFQTDNGLPASGVLDRVTLAHLDAKLREVEDTKSGPAPLTSAAAATCNRKVIDTLTERIYLGGGKKKDKAVPIYEIPGRSGYFYRAKMSVDVDGAPKAYHKNDKVALDYLANGGEPGNWWALATDNGKASGNPLVQGPNDPAPGYYISQTSLRKGPYASVDSYVNAEDIPYLVFPAGFHDVSVGDCGIIVSLKTKKFTHAMFADTNPRVGEASYRAAVALGVKNPSPKNGGDDEDNYVYMIFPGSKFVPEANAPHWPNDKIRQVAMEHFGAWGGMAQLRACFPELA